jgi:hypothetical protein
MLKANDAALTAANEFYASDDNRDANVKLIAKLVAPGQLKALQIIADPATRVYTYYSGNRRVVDGMGVAMFEQLHNHRLVTTVRPQGSYGSVYDAKLTRLGQLVLAALTPAATFTSADGRTHDAKTGRYVKKA